MATKNAPTQSADKGKPIPQHLKYDAKAFDAAEGEVYGGASDILHPEENDIVGPLVYLGFRTGVDLGNGMPPVDIHEARDTASPSNQYRLPIVANFKRQMELATLVKGDVFVIKRLPDVIKARGAGKGNPMEMYQVKVIERVQRTVAATA